MKTLFHPKKPLRCTMQKYIGLKISMCLRYIVGLSLLYGIQLSHAAVGTGYSNPTIPSVCNIVSEATGTIQVVQLTTFNSALFSSNVDITIPRLQAGNVFTNPMNSGTTVFTMLTASTTQPSVGTPAQAANVPFTITPNSTVYVTAGVGPSGEVCVYSVEINAAGNGFVTGNTRYVGLAAASATAQTAVPVFTPLGIVMTVGGLLWFGRRRKLAQGS